MNLLSKAKLAKPTGKKKINSQASIPKKPIRTLLEWPDELLYKEPNVISDIILIPSSSAKLCSYKVQFVRNI